MCVCVCVCACACMHVCACVNVCVTVHHCIISYSRAPVLVAIALIENGMKYHDAVDTIRRSVYYLHVYTCTDVYTHMRQIILHVHVYICSRIVLIVQCV